MCLLGMGSLRCITGGHSQEKVRSLKVDLSPNVSPLLRSQGSFTAGLGSLGAQEPPHFEHSAMPIPPREK